MILICIIFYQSIKHFQEKKKQIYKQHKIAILTRPRLSPISKLLAIPPNELATVLATTSSVSVARFRLIEMTIYMPLKGGL